MPYTVALDKPPAGYSMTVARGGEKVGVSYREFVSFEDGEKLISRLEGFPTILLKQIPNPDLKPSTVDHLFAVIKSDGNCQVFVNECEIVAKTRVRRDIKKGEAIYESDIVDYQEVVFKGVEVAPDAGIAVVFSVGWRKGFYYDFGPLQAETILRDYSIWETLGVLHNYLCFQEYFKISDDEYRRLFDKLWFPFIGLKKETVTKLLSHIRGGWDPDELMEVVQEEVRQGIDGMLARWKKHPSLSEHSELLERACERFKSGDYLSCSAVLYPRIEGILRSISRCTGGGYTQRALAKAPSDQASTVSISRVLPDKFVEYLREVYFRNFDPEYPDHISRNTVGHGVAPQSLYDSKAASIGLLVVEQIYLQLPASPAENEE